MFETQKPILNCLSTTQLYSVKEYTITIIAPPPKKKNSLVHSLSNTSQFSHRSMVKRPYPKLKFLNKYLLIFICQTLC